MEHSRWEVDQKDGTGDLPEAGGLRVSKDVGVMTEGDVVEYGDNPTLVLYPALREGKELYRAAGSS